MDVVDVTSPLPLFTSSVSDARTAELPSPKSLFGRLNNDDNNASSWATFFDLSSVHFMRPLFNAKISSNCFNESEVIFYAW
jgi:hypothetical protein